MIMLQDMKLKALKNKPEPEEVFICDCCDQVGIWVDECETCGHLLCEECSVAGEDEMNLCVDCDKYN